MEPILAKILEANKKRCFQENIEDNEPTFQNPEYQELAEMSIEEAWSSCTKKQGHDGFIPWKDFKSDPVKYCNKNNLSLNEKTLQYIDTIASFTACLEVKFVSKNRPEFHKKLFEHRGTEHLFTGSGYAVYDVKISNHPCKCIKCKMMSRTNVTEIIKSFSVYIATATHVVYDDEEAKNMTAELHYNDNDRKHVKKLYGVSLCERSVNGDSCIVECVTCDEELANEVKANLEKCQVLHRQFPRSEQPIVVIISHPHGKYKHISFGERETSQTQRQGLLSLTSFEYNATTCPGSSGAPVLLMNDTCNFRGSKFELLNSPAHSGVNSEGTNFSGTTSNPTLKRSLSKVKKKDLQNVQHPVRVEAHLHKHLVGCEKNPGHKDFVPVNDFNIYHLPEGHQDTNLVEFVNFLADLTVRVGVKMISTERPEFWPGTTIPYVFYHRRGSDVLRVGTGIIVLVHKISEDKKMTCNCHTCQHSEVPSKVYFHVYVQTATHVVFDNLEAQNTTVRIFYDRQDSPLVTLDGWHVVDSDIVGDTCYLKCVTHDESIAEELSKVTEHLWETYKNIKDKHESDISIIISHPHGCPKQVSVGQEIKGYILAENYDITLTKHTYTTCTCPGSSGAAVFIFSKDASLLIEKYITHHVHSDALDNGLNKCSLSVDKFN